MRIFLGEPLPLLEGSLAEYIERWWWPRVKVKTKPLTQVAYKSIVDNHLTDLQAMQLTDIRLPTLQEFVNQIERQPKTVHSIYAVLKQILEMASRTGHYPHRDHLLVQTPKVTKRHRKALTLGECFDLMKDSGNLEGPIFAASILGLRRGEICGLKRSDLKDNVLTLSRQGLGNAPLKSRAEGQTRRIALPEAIAGRLRELSTGTEYMFEWDGKPINPDRLTQTFIRYADGVTLHDLRHACRTNLSALGLRPETIMAILGHTTMETSLIYQQTRDDDIRTELGKLAELLPPHLETVTPK